MKKICFIISTIIIMLIVSRFIVRIVDATVQIDNDIGILAVFVIIVNMVLGYISYRIYRATDKK